MPDLLSAKYWQNKNAVTGTAIGRGTTYFVSYERQEWVLRHYYRGGLIGKAIKDTYFYIGEKHTRAAKEFSLLALMHSLGLPVPTPIACSVTRKGLGYNADILTQRIEKAQDLVEILSHRELSKNVWRKIGACIQKFHCHGIYHHDLNAHNILIDENEKIWLIDFDRGEQRTVKQSWQKANLNRLHRSFLKEQKRLPTFYWQPEHWQMLIEGYLVTD